MKNWTWDSWLHQKKREQHSEGGDFAPLLHSREIPSEVWHPDLGSPAQESPEDGHKNDHRAATTLWRQVERAGIVQPQKKSSLGRLYCSVPIGKGSRKKDEDTLLEVTEPEHSVKGFWFRLCIRKIFSIIGK